jgi:hypothetical protein
MTIVYEIDREWGLIRTRCTGDVTFPEVIQHFRDLQGDDSLPPRLDVLLDLTGMDSIPESNQLDTIAQEVEALKPKIEWGACVVVADRDVLFGMSRVFQAFAQEQFSASNVVRDLDEAERWLASLRR